PPSSRTTSSARSWPARSPASIGLGTATASATRAPPPATPDASRSPGGRRRRSEVSDVALTLPDPATKAAAVRSMFDRIAPPYERLNTTLTFGLDRGWRRAAIAAAGVGPGDLVVDVACGTGGLAALATAAGARVIGIDVARAMLVRARGRAAALVLAD